MTLHNVLKDIPNDSFLTIYNLLSTLNRLHDTALDELTDDEWLIELCRHILRDTTFVHLKLWTYDDNRTSRIVYTLTEKVLTETTLLTLKAIRERLKGAIVIATYST